MAPVANVVTTPGVVPVAHRTFHELGEYYDCKAVVIPECDAHTWSYAISQGWCVVQVKRPAIPHPLSHVAREVAMLTVAASSLRGLRSVRIFSVYGAQRDKRLLEVAARTEENSIEVELTIGPNEVYPGDAGKLTALREDPTGLYNLVVLTDVYWGSKGAFAPSDARRWAEHSVSQSIYMILRSFHGAAGSDKVPGFCGAIEGVWYRDAKGMVNFSSDAAGYGYPLHPSIDWLQHKTIDGLSVTYLDSKGPYDIFKIAVENQSTVRVAVELQPAKEGEFAWRKRATSVWQCVPHTWSAWCTQDRRGWLVHNATVAALSPTFKYKIPLGHTCDVARGQTEKHLGESQTYEQLVQRWPAIAEKVLCDTADCALYAGRETASQEQYDLREAHQKSEELLVSARSPKFMPVPRLNMKWVRVFFAMIVAWVFLTWISNLGVHARILGPFEGEVRGEEWWFGTFVVTSAILLATFINRSSRVTSRTFQDWVSQRERGEESAMQESGWCALTESDTIPAEQVRAWNFSIGRGDLVIEVDGKEMGAEEAAGLLEDEVVKQSIAPVLVTNGLLHQPAKTDLNLLAAIIQRLHTTVKGETDPLKLEQIWMKAAKRMADLVLGHHGEIWTIQACAASMGGEKGRRLLSAWEQLELGKTSDCRKEIMVKWNETIVWKEVEGELTVKPRAITVLSNDLHVVFAPTAHGVADVLHRIFDGTTHCAVTVFFASGYNGAKLNEMGTALSAGGDGVCVSGDDSMAVKRGGWQQKGRAFLRFGEGDFSAYDQSQRAHCLTAHAVWMTALGLPKLLIDLILWVCSMPYRARGKRVKVKGKAGCQLATGIDWTTVINSMSNLCFWLEVFASGEDPEKVAYRMGFELKFRAMPDIHGVTFLKGWWIRDTAFNLCWYPLPSQVVKLGKTHRPLKLFSAGKKNYAEGVASLAYALARSMATVPIEYPILGPFLSKLSELGKETSFSVSASEDGWFKPQVHAVSVCRSQAISMMCERYELTEQDILRSEKLIGRVTSLPAFLCDPVFLALSRRDYA